MSVKFHTVCPVCHQSLEFDTDSTEFWGHIEITDLGCASVTRPFAPEVEAHIQEHRVDGSLNRALLKRWEYYAEYAAGVVERLKPFVIDIDQN